ncbi:MAG: LPS export ABC transporter periplasmic protein LptC [Alphaproteobacteria bacterium]|nr:LPS export ABC transporter periplasmic protein LptC [Alphaproteobacteria bacterium]
MLDPKEIDTYFNADALKKKVSSAKIARHTRKVMLAKHTLPAIAAILAVTLIVLPSLKDDIKDFGLDFNIGKGDIEQLNIKNTTMYVTDEKNRVNNFVAQQVQETSANSKIYDLLNPEGMMPLDNEEWINIKSPKGVFDQNTSLLKLTDMVEIFYSKGMNISTQEAFFDFHKSYGYSNHTINGDGFIGQIRAQGFEYKGQNNILSFTGKTHILLNEESLK